MKYNAAAPQNARLPDVEEIVADKGYDSEWIREQITKKGARAVIPRKRNSLKGNADMDGGLYKYRHLVENAFTRLKQYWAIATRYDKLEAKLRKYGSHSVWISVATYVKCQQTLVLKIEIVCVCIIVCCHQLL
jgi:transposase